MKPLFYLLLANHTLNHIFFSDYQSELAYFSEVIDTFNYNSNSDEEEYLTNGYMFVSNDDVLINDLLNSISLDEMCEKKICIKQAVDNIVHSKQIFIKTNS